jgi:hypothetical protein
VARKSIEELQDKEKTPVHFIEFIKERIGDQTFSFLEKIASFSNVLIFSGIIRNYFINYFGEVRDFDIVVDCDEKEFDLFLTTYNYQKNSFGGYKISIGNLKVDVWHIQSTWAIKNHKLQPELFINYTLPQTTFFNFSAIVFDFKQKEFIYGREFKNFLLSGEIDLVLKENPSPPLCIVNTIYYKHKYHLHIAKNLEEYCLENFSKYSEQDFIQIQVKHFGDVKYSYSYLKEYIKIFKKHLEKEKNKENHLVAFMPQS